MGHLFMRVRAFSTKELLDSTVKLLQSLLVPFQVPDYFSEVFRNLVLFFIQSNAGLLKNMDRFSQGLELDINQVFRSNSFDTDEIDVSTEARSRR